MKLLTLMVILCSRLGQFICDYNSDCQLRGKQKLDGLVVTWPLPNTTNPWAYSPLPRTTKEAQDQKWTLLDDGCMNSSLQHKGKRYILGEDLSVITIYDGQGHVAGIQTTIPKALADSGGVVDYSKLSFMHCETIRGQERYILTMYFINPSSICSGRSDEQFEEEGTYNQVFIWKGSNNYLIPPLTEDNTTLAAQNWTTGLCVETMGTHYYYEASVNQKCSDVQPYFMVYDCGRLIALEIFMVGNFSQEPRYEYAPKELFKPFIDPLPSCLLDVYEGKPKGITCLHIYFTREPTKVKCPEGGKNNISI